MIIITIQYEIYLAAAPSVVHPWKFCLKFFIDLAQPSNTTSRIQSGSACSLLHWPAETFGLANAKHGGIVVAAQTPSPTIARAHSAS